ncbi:S8 family peptidase [Risungbinella massiliensis]|uniref:S8 family peptidase n=1 Tax=Risungbinella massiliensis TaxID=1329796 RepID=UPI0005CBEB0C|nr:S8 family peptidase [Risungbinella massiliensis]
MALGMEKTDQPFALNQMLIKMKKEVAVNEKNQFYHNLKGTVLKRNKELDFEVMELEVGEDIERKVKMLQLDEKVEYVEPNYTYTTQAIPNDPFQGFQYGLTYAKAHDAWNYSTGFNLKIAILDTGVQTDHPDLMGKLVTGYNVVNGTTDVTDISGHGTHVAGICGAVTNNNLGVAGMAPSASIMPIKVLSDNGMGFVNHIAEGIIYAIEQGCKVINLSLGGPYNSITLQNAINYAWSRGAVVVAAAGNSGSFAATYPATYPNVISVAATNQFDQRAYFSNFGPWVDVAAPGVDILSTYLASNYAFLSGTSMATPFVSGLAAILLAQGRDNTNVRAVIQLFADRIAGTGIYWQYGRINALRSVMDGL